MSGTRQGRGGEPPDRHGSLGPVEPAEGTRAPAARPSDPPRTRRPTKRQIYAVAALLLAAATLVTVRHAAGPNTAALPEQAANSPPPYPAQIAHFHYAGVRSAATGPGAEFVLLLTVEDEGPGPVDLLALRQGYRGLSAEPLGPVPRRIEAGAVARLEVRFLVTDCAAAPPDAGMPFLDVTLRNTRAIQTASQILGDGYPGDLSRNLHIACPDSDIRTRVPVPPSPNTTVR
ncbi:Tat pathway signal sequence domain protein [Kitasatospora sp. NPDC048540]|uniref:Tat pathway signal sequence domain protein n=1 Tax=Kitasatospora sp. NPDC048540 TaxID=3155634 RepID=UPI0033FADDE7